MGLFLLFPNTVEWQHQMQKIFLIFNNGNLFHKPGLIVSISSGNGGAYPDF